MSAPDVSQLTGSLSQLQDIIMPEAVGLFPPAPGFYPIGLVLIFLSMKFLMTKYRSFKQNLYRRQALDQLKIIEKIILLSQDDALRIRAASSLPVLLKRTAISAFGRENTAALSHGAWISFLNSKTPRVQFSSTAGEILSTCAWGSDKQIQNISEGELKGLISLIGTWIKTHERQVNKKNDHL